MIELKNLTKVYNTGENRVEAIKNINLKIEKGDIFGIIGLSGAGKSTLVRCINLLEKATEGEVIFKGKSLSKLTNSELLKTRQSISMIFQNFNLLSQRTALKNICYPLEIAGVSKKEAKERAYELLEIVGLPDKAKAYPSQLSGGQKQRVAIARALATNPEVLLCDEATSALDPNTTSAILELLKKINTTMGVTIVIITHEMRVVEQICNKVAVLDNSQIVEVGNVSDVFLAPKSSIAKELILPKTNVVENKLSDKCIRIVFDGESAFEPIISSLSLECHAFVNILGADTKEINGKACGQMLLQLPQDETSVKRIYKYLNDKNITYKEEIING